jgi:hypothetical protein
VDTEKFIGHLSGKFFLLLLLFLFLLFNLENTFSWDSSTGSYPELLESTHPFTLLFFELD